MRLHLLPLCLIAIALTGCVTQYKPVEPFPTEKQARHTPAPKKTVRHSSPVKLYTDATELVRKPFRDLGEVSSEDCQRTAQDSPVNMNTARKRLQIKAASLKANAILLHQCEVITTHQGCYRQAICQGSALEISQ